MSSSVKDEKWIDIHHDPVASLSTLSQCMVLADLSADGDYKLIMADLGTGSYGMKLRVYKGTSILSENNIIDLPTGVVSFYMDTLEPHVPAIAVASGPCIYVYKNLRPYFRFTLPTIDLDPREQQLWEDARQGKFGLTGLREQLDNLKSEGAPLTPRSLQLLILPPSELEDYFELHKDTPLKRQTVVTCLATLKKNMPEDFAISCLVLGTENCSIYVLDPEAFTILGTMKLAAVPVFLNVSGLFDVEFGINVACRNGAIYTLKRGMQTGRLLAQLSSQPVGLEKVNKVIMVGCMDNTLHCFTTKGKRLWSVPQPASITAMRLLDHKSRGLQALLVALDNMQVRMYKDKHLVHEMTLPDVITGLCFGRFGREEATLIMTTKGGGLLIKMIKRTAKFEDRSAAIGPPAAQNQRLDVPKKTKIFVDQTLRERENAVAMHRQFQHDLYRLRLEAARSYVVALDKSLTPISNSPHEPLKLSAQVLGIGPNFRLVVQLQNTSINTPSMDLRVTFHYDDRLYKVNRPVIQVPLLVPGLNYSFDAMVTCLNDKGISDVIKVFVTRPGKSVPIIAAAINMPVSEALVIV